MTVDQKKAEITDAKGWVEDLKELNASGTDIKNACRYVLLLENDLKKLEGERDVC
jgi:hypothetical protein